MKAKTRSGTIWPVLVTLTLAGILSDWSKATAQEAMFNVYFNTSNPAGKTLTEVERRRLEALTRLVMDAGIEVIYSGLPAWPAAEQIGNALHIKAKLISRKPEVMDDLVRRLHTEHTAQRVLIFAGNTVRNHIAKAYNIKDIWKRSENLIVIVPKSHEEPVVIKMRW